MKPEIRSVSAKAGRTTAGSLAAITADLLMRPQDQLNSRDVVLSAAAPSTPPVRQAAAEPGSLDT